ncbi:MAG TPA: glycosyltransferase family 2 protein [bacterium]|nr:glycosyltransferase family 2 protein [bacterium]
MPTIAFTLIGHNEAEQLPRCLEAVRWADELIYVDCGSTDGSYEVARRYTERVFRRPNLKNLNVNKAYGIQQATTDWVFYLDPDEVITEALAQEIRAVIAGDPPQNAFRLPRRNYFFGSWLRYGGQYPDTQLRLFRRGKAWFPCKHVHEKLEVEGQVGTLREAMHHFTNPTPAEAFHKLDFYSTFNAELWAREGRRPSLSMAVRWLAWKPTVRFLRRYLLKGGFRDGWPGVAVAVLDGMELQMRFLKFAFLAQHPEALPPEAPPEEAPTEPPTRTAEGS